MPHDPTGRRVLLKVVEQYGSEGAAVRLGVSEALLSRLLAGLVHVPDSLLVRAIDLLPEHAPPVSDVPTKRSG